MFQSHIASGMGYHAVLSRAQHQACEHDLLFEGVSLASTVMIGARWEGKKDGSVKAHCHSYKSSRSVSKLIMIGSYWNARRALTYKG